MVFSLITNQPPFMYKDSWHEAKWLLTTAVKGRVYEFSGVCRGECGSEQCETAFSPIKFPLISSVNVYSLHVCVFTNVLALDLNFNNILNMAAICQVQAHGLF